MKSKAQGTVLQGELYAEETNSTTKALFPSLLWPARVEKQQQQQSEDNIVKVITNIKYTNKP